MNNANRFSIIKTILFDIFIALIGCLGVVFTVLYVDTFESGLWFSYSSVITAVSVSLISILTVLTITLSSNSKSFVYKLFMLVVICLSVIVIVLYFLKTTGFLSKVDSVDKFREYISSFGNQAIFWFTIIQFLQVVVLPIPAFITVGAGVLLFGPLKGAIFSSIGIILGSIVAFYIGRIFGFKVAKWLVGEDSLNKGLKIIEGKDKIILTFMFLFPFFPDDILCFVAGITTISSSFFITMIIVTRIISVFASSYSMNNSIIPYDTWWGIMLWLIFILFTIVSMVVICKKGNKIQDFFARKKKQKKNWQFYMILCQTWWIKMNILVSNDDGIKSNGLIELVNRLKQKHNVLVVAPDGNRSASSHSLTITKSIKVEQNFELEGCTAYQISGTPADCVKIAELMFKDFNTDIVVAGINKGHNIGSDILYSGTVAIACEASFFGNIAFAFSAYSLFESNFVLYAEYAEKIIEYLLPVSRPGDVWNVNFPPTDEIKGVKITTLGKQYYTDEYVKVGKNEYVLQGEIIIHDENDIDTDVELIKQGYITITPILFNKTNYNKVEEIKDLCIRL